MLNQRFGTIRDGRTEVVAEGLHVLWLDVLGELFELRCFVFGRPYQDIHGVVPGFQKRNQIVHFHVHASLEGGLQSRHSHALVRVAQPAPQGDYRQRWMAHACGPD